MNARQDNQLADRAIVGQRQRQFPSNLVGHPAGCCKARDCPLPDCVNSKMSIEIDHLTTFKRKKRPGTTCKKSTQVQNSVQSQASVLAPAQNLLPKIPKQCSDSPYLPSILGPGLPSDETGLNSSDFNRSSLMTTYKRGEKEKLQAADSSCHSKGLSDFLPPRFPQNVPVMEGCINQEFGHKNEVCFKSIEPASNQSLSEFCNQNTPIAEPRGNKAFHDLVELDASQVIATLNGAVLKETSVDNPVTLGYALQSLNTFIRCMISSQLEIYGIRLLKQAEQNLMVVWSRRQNEIRRQAEEFYASSSVDLFSQLLPSLAPSPSQTSLSSLLAPLTTSSLSSSLPSSSTSSSMSFSSSSASFPPSPSLSVTSLPAFSSKVEVAPLSQTNSCPGAIEISEEDTFWFDFDEELLT